MTTKRFNNLSILSIQKELTDSINLVDIGNEFASKYDGRRMNLGKFFPSDLLCLYLNIGYPYVHCESKLVTLYY